MESELPGAGEIQTKGRFGDVQLHIQWAAPAPPQGTGQDRGNSGVFFMGLYELQILDSYLADTYTDGQAAAIYGQYPPLFNAARPPGQWQTYDVAFRRPRFGTGGTLLEPARISVFHNGILVQNNEEILGPTRWLKWSPYEGHEEHAPIKLQDHGHRVRFRNIWLIELPERSEPSPRGLERPKAIEITSEALQPFVGGYSAKPETDASKLTRISSEGNHLVLTTAGVPSHSHMLLPVAPNVFEMHNSDVRMSFLRNADGRVASARLSVGGEDRLLIRVALKSRRTGRPISRKKKTRRALEDHQRFSGRIPTTAS